MSLVGRGVLYPARLPTFHRVAAPARVSALVRWFWIPEWRIAAGRSSRQHVIAFPASNLVVEPDAVGFVGPTTRASHRDLTGTGWAVGALLRPAAVPFFTDDPAGLRDARQPVDAPAPHAGVSRAMTGSPDRQARHRAAVEAFTQWLAVTIPAPGPEALLANSMAELIEADPSVLRVEDAARQLGVSVRTVQRLARRYVGLSPLTMIRRRRLQEAAERVRADPDANLAVIAAELGYADHAHLANDFRSVLGFTPSAYRDSAYRNRAARADPAEA